MRERPVRVPAELRVCALIMFGAGVAFLLLGFALLGVDAYADARALQPPALTALLGLAVATGLVLRIRLARAIALVAVVVFALLHLVIVFNQGPWFARLGSGVLAAAYVYAGVLLNTGPVRDYVEGADG